MRSQYAVTDPTNGEVVEEYPESTDEQISRAIASAQETYRAWRASGDLPRRVELIERVADAYQARREELAHIIVTEMGKPIAQARGEIDFSRDIYRYFASIAPAALADAPMEAQSDAAFIRRQAIGPVLGIMPWNFPYYQVARFAGANLLLGNPVILKHAPQCPRSAWVMEEIFASAGFPEGAYINVYATHAQVERIIGDERVQGVSLTGSGRAGRAVAQIAGRHLKKVVLELGGSDAFILLSTDDLDADVRAAVASRLDNSGQSCNAAKRFIIHRDLHDEFLARLTRELTAIRVDDPALEDTELAPLSSLAAAQRLEEQIEEAVAAGARVVARGRREGAWFPPAVLTDVSPDNPAYHQELFGPVAMVFRADDEDEAVRIANDTPYGLSAYIRSTDAGQALRVADRMETGMVSINGAVIEAPELPFGGVKASGFGRELGPSAFDEFANRKLIAIRP